MVNKLRPYLLAFLRNWHDFWATCWRCGRMGASVHSLIYPKRLCNVCGTKLSRNPELLKEWT